MSAAAEPDHAGHDVPAALYAFHDRFSSPDALPQAVRHQARRCLLDLIGVAAAGSRTKLAELIAKHAVDQFGADGKPASILFEPNGRKASAAGAALAGGMTIDAIDAHDGHPLTKGHAGCGLFPALLALAETEASGMPVEVFLAHLAIGYEIAVRCGIGLHDTAPDYHTSGAWIAVGVAATGALMLGLDVATMRHAMGIGEYHGPRSQMMRCIDHPTMLKDGSGWGVMAGVSALGLARSGFTGAPALTVEDDAVAHLWADLGTRWRIGEQYFKPWPVCRWAQPAIEAALELKAAHQFEAGDIAEVRVHTFHEATRLAARTPGDTEEAQYSLPFPVAVALARDSLGASDINGDGLADPDVLRLAAKIALVEAAPFNEVFPAERWADVEITLADGTRLRSGPCTSSGDADTPLSDASISEKFHALMAEAGYGDRAAPIEAMVLEPDDAKVSDLLRFVSV